jgi:hypothetical protein
MNQILGQVYKASFMVFLVSILTTGRAYSQLFVGPTLGGQDSWVVFNDRDKSSDEKLKPKFGFNAGGTVSFRVHKRFFLTTSVLYSTKGKKLTGTTDPDLRHKVTYRFIDIPVVYSVDFKAKVGKTSEFKYFLGIGPNLSYWLGGRGTLYNGDLNEHQHPPIDFKIVFKKNPATLPENQMTVTDANRIQLGLNLAGGFSLEPLPDQKFLFVVRYEIGHSFYSDVDGGIFYSDVLYKDKLRSRNQGIRISMTYMFDLKTDERKKGKSTIKQKHGR